MTATQMKRIRRNLAKAAELTEAAFQAAVDGHGDDDLRALTARAHSGVAASLRSLEAWDAQFAANAETIARSLGIDRGETR